MDQGNKCQIENLHRSICLEKKRFAQLYEIREKVFVRNLQYFSHETFRSFQVNDFFQIISIVWGVTGRGEKYCC